MPPIVRWPGKMGMYQAGRASLEEARAASAKRLPSAEPGDTPTAGEHEEFLADSIVQPPLPTAAKLSKTRSSLMRALTLLKRKHLLSVSKEHKAVRSEEPQPNFSPSAAFRVIRGVLRFRGMAASKMSVQITPVDTDHEATGAQPPASLDEAIERLNALGKDDDWRARKFADPRATASHLQACIIPA